MGKINHKEGTRMSKKYMLNTLITAAGHSGECPPNNIPLECGFDGNCHECWLEWAREQLLNELGIGRIEKDD